MSKRYSKFSPLGANVVEIIPSKLFDRNSEHAKVSHYIRLLGAALVRHIRKSAKFTQAEVANRLGVTQARVSQIERGDGEPSLSFLAELADEVGASIELVVVVKGQTQIRVPLTQKNAR